MSAKGSSVLVIGGGFAGVNFAKGATAAGYKVVLVDPKNFFSVTFASLRAVVIPTGQTAKDHIFEYSKIPGIGTFKQGRVTALSKSSAVLQTGEVLNFDYCVIATGSTNAAGAYAQPQSLDIQGRRSEIQATGDRIHAAKKIVIVGAGAVGVELAAEIVEAFAGKGVTLVASTATLFEGRPKKVGKRAAEWLTSRKVEILYNERVTKRSDTSVALKSGAELSADLVIWTVGAKPNTEFLRSTELASTLDAAGRVKVDPTLRIIGFDNMFALGDINNVDEEKLGYLATLQAQLTAKNLAALKKGGKVTPWVPSNGTKGIMLTLGSKTGTGAMNDCVLPGCMVSMFKSKTLFVPKVRDELQVAK